IPHPPSRRRTVRRVTIAAFREAVVRWLGLWGAQTRFDPRHGSALEAVISTPDDVCAPHDQFGVEETCGGVCVAVDGERLEPNSNCWSRSARQTARAARTNRAAIMAALFPVRIARTTTARGRWCGRRRRPPRAS